MEKKQYDEIAKKHRPKPKVLINSIKAFVIGGLLGMLGEYLIVVYMDVFNLSRDDAATPMIVTLVLVASLLTGFGVFDKIGQFAGAGTLVPVTGFANSMTSAALEHKSEGIVLGIATNLFKLAGSVITLGVVSAAVLGTIRYLFFGG